MDKKEYINLMVAYEILGIARDRLIKAGMEKEISEIHKIMKTVSNKFDCVIENGLRE